MQSLIECLSMTSPQYYRLTWLTPSINKYLNKNYKKKNRKTKYTFSLRKEKKEKKIQMKKKKHQNKVNLDKHLQPRNETEQHTV